MGINYNNFLKFERQLKREFKFASEEAILERKKEIAKVALESLVTATPYKTGRAKSNWQVGLDEPIDTEVTFVQSRDEKGRFSGGFKAVKNRVIDSGTAAQLDLMVIRKGETVIDKSELGQKIFITNNVPYIDILDDRYHMTAIADSNVKVMT